MTAIEALKNLAPNKWAATSIIERLALLEQVQKNLQNYAKELGTADAKMKNQSSRRYGQYHYGNGKYVDGHTPSLRIVNAWRHASAFKY